MSKKSQSVSSYAKTGPPDHGPVMPTGNKTRSINDRGRLLQMVIAGSDKDHHHGDNATRYRDADASVSMEYGTTGGRLEGRDHQPASTASHAPQVVVENTYRLEPQVILYTSLVGIGGTKQSCWV